MSREKPDWDGIALEVDGINPLRRHRVVRMLELGALPADNDRAGRELVRYLALAAYAELLARGLHPPVLSLAEVAGQFPLVDPHGSDLPGPDNFPSP